MPFDSTKYTIEYQKKFLEEIRFRVKKGQKEVIQGRAKELDLSMAAYFQKLVEKDLNGEINWE